jgi:polyisoprenoid-binding protein YceI
MNRQESAMRITPVALVLLLSAPSLAQQPSYFHLDQDSHVTYTVVHRLHRVDAVANRIEARALFDGTNAQVMVRVPVDAFDSGNVNRDAHMKEVVEAARFPQVVVKAVGELHPPLQFPATVHATFKAQLQFHGVTEQVDLPIDLAWQTPEHVQASAHFTLSLEHYQVKRPSFLFVPLDDGLQIAAELRFAKDVQP